MQDALGWAALMGLSMVLMIMGVQGKMGVVLACLFCPAQVVEDVA